MTSNASERRDEVPNGDQIATTPTKLIGIGALPPEFQFDVTAGVLGVQPQDICPVKGLSMFGGHICGKVAVVNKYYYRKSVGLVLNFMDGTPYLECEIPVDPNDEESKLQLPAVMDKVRIAMNEPTFNPLSRKIQYLPFKLIFHNVLMSIEPAKADMEPRFVNIQKPSPDVQDNHVSNHPEAVPPKVPANAAEDNMDIDACPEEHPMLQDSSDQQCVELPAQTAAKQQETRRVRKNDTRKVSKPAQKIARMAERANSTTTQNQPEAVEEPIKQEAQDEEMETNTDAPETEPELPEMPETPEQPAALIEEIEDTFEAIVTEPSPPPVIQEPEGGYVYQLGMGDVFMYNAEPTRSNKPLENGLRLPPRFTSLGNVGNMAHGDPINIIGVVVTLGESKATQKGTYIFTLSLCDQSSPTDGLRVTLFCNDKASVPDVVIGQMLLLQNVRVDLFQTRATCLGTQSNWKWVGYDHDTGNEFFNQEPTCGARLDHTTSQEERQYMKELGDWYKEKGKIVEVVRDYKHKLLSQLGEGFQFFNATVEVLHIEVNDASVALFVTDYTMNEDFNLWPGPNGKSLPRKRTLRLWIESDDPELLEPAKNMEVGKIYKLSNIRYRKHGRADTWNMNFEIQRRKPTSDDPDVQRLMEQKESFKPEDEPTEEVNVSSKSVPPLSRPNPKTMKPVPVEEPLSGEQIICQQNVPTLSFSDVSALPDTGFQFKITARIIDIAPPDQKDMICLVCKECKTRFYGQQTCDKCGTDEHLDIDIRICLFVVDEKHEWLPIRVAGDDAKKLFNLESLNGTKERLDVDVILRDMVKKLRNVVGNLWTNPPTQDRFKDGVEFDVNALAEAVQSPWIDLIVHSWQEYDAKDGTWITRFNLMDCVFQSPNQRTDSD